MKKTLLIILLALLLPFAFAEETGLLVNGGLSSSDGITPDGWGASMWIADGVSDLTCEDGEACIYNRSDNDARFAQKIAVEPDTLYRIACKIKALGVTEGSAGANLSIENTFANSAPLYDTDDEWVDVQLYGRTAADQTELTVYLRLGGYSAEATGIAWFSDVTMEAVDEAPEGASIQSFATFKPSSGNSSAASGDAGEPTRNTPCYALLTFLGVFALIALFRKAERAPEREEAVYRRRLWLVLGVAAALRIAFAMLVPGYNTDVNCFSSWANHMFDVGPLRFYETVSWCDYPPLYMLMLWPAGALTALFNLSYRSPVHLLILKLVPLLFDLMAATLLYPVAKKRLGARAALILSAFVALNPALIADSAAWGQIDSVFTFFLLLCAMYAAEDRYVVALPCFVAALLTKPQALLLGPIGLAFALTHTLRGDKENLGRRAKDLLMGILAAAALLGAAGLLFAPNRVHFAAWLVELYSGTVQGYRYLTVNCLNLWTLLDKNWAATDEHALLNAAAWALFALSYLYCLALTIVNRDKKRLALLGGTLLMLLSAFGPMMHERYVYPALLLLTFALCYDRDWRICIGAIVLTATLFLNEVLVLQGGMTAVNEGHLQRAEAWINAPVSLIVCVNALWMAFVAGDIVLRDHVVPFRAPTARECAVKRNPSCLHLRGRDYLIMGAVTAAYAVLAFTNLGSMSAPQTYWQSGSSGESVTFDLGEVQSFRMTYYGNICDTNFTVELSADGETYTEPVYAAYSNGDIFRWLYFVPCDEENDKLTEFEMPEAVDGVTLLPADAGGEAFPMQAARYVRITAESAGLKLCEIGFLDADGTPLPIAELTQDAEDPISNATLLMDEQETIPAAPSCYNSSYFDEIYHARTAYEHLNGLNTYEWTHPPLGKVMIMLGIKLFGMTPFGWRFMGALVGVLMLPLMYLLARQLTKSTPLSTVAMALMALDSMHFTQTRIATIDSFAVFWIMLMYLFMFRFVQTDWTGSRTFRRSLVPLGLCGVTMGIAWATKWIGIYASIGLAVLYFAKLIGELRRTPSREENPFDARRACVISLAFCVVFFLIVPALIYYFSYYWHLQALGVKRFTDMFSMDYVRKVVNLQKDIFNYHNGLGGDTHYFRSPWYQWPVIGKPMWYYSGNEYLAEGMVSSISCMGNPAVWWGGLVALFCLLARTAWVRRAPKAHSMVLVGYASQFLPWVLITRSTFIYHYFASVPFLILAIVLMLKESRKLDDRLPRDGALLLVIVAAILFALFYPLESGLPCPRSYAMLLRWFNWYNFAL